MRLFSSNRNLPCNPRPDREALRCASRTVSHSNSRAVRRSPINRSSSPHRGSKNRSRAARHRINRGKSHDRVDDFRFLTDGTVHTSAKGKVQSAK